MPTPVPVHCHLQTSPQPFWCSTLYSPADHPRAVPEQVTNGMQTQSAPSSLADEQVSEQINQQQSATQQLQQRLVNSSRAMQDCEEVLTASPWERKCAKRRMEALQALGFSSAAYQVAPCCLALLEGRGLSAPFTVTRSGYGHACKSGLLLPSSGIVGSCQPP